MQLLDWARQGVVGRDAVVETPYGSKRKLYFDYTASGLPFRPIEDWIAREVLPYYANTHSESAACASRLSALLREAYGRIRDCIHADSGDSIVFCGSGSTSAINRLIHVLGMRLPARMLAAMGGREALDPALRPVVFLSRMEHHSNDITWRESVGDVVFVGYDKKGRIDPRDLDRRLREPWVRERPLRFGSFSAASNVTGITSDVDALAEVMHAHSGQAFFDYAAAAPYLTVDMHPARPECRKDAVFVSVHKFLGGPQTPGLLAARNDLFAEPVPAEPGGGTVLYTSPWEWRYLGDPEEREQGGTPPIVQVVRAALAFELKRMLGADRILAAEEELSRRLLHRWRRHPRIDLLGMDEADDTRELLAGVPGGTGEAGAASPRRLGIFSLIFDGGRLHHHLAVRLLSDRFGIQVRGGCMCAGTYGHDLLGISQEQSEGIRQQLDLGLGCRKPGWVRVSLSPVSTAAEVDFLADAVDELLERWGEWQRDYVQDEHSGEWRHRSFTPPVPALRLDPEAPGAPFTSPS